MATTYNFTDKSLPLQVVPPEESLSENRIVVRRNILDFSINGLDAGEGDIAKAINIPANTTVLTAFIRVITAETANGTCDLGYGDNVDQWGDALSLAAADVVVGYLDAPVFFAEADTIDVVATTDSADVDLDGAKIEVTAIMIKHLDAY